MAEREALWGWDLDESPAEPVDQDRVDARYDSRNGHDPITEPIPLTHDDLAGRPDGDLATLVDPEPPAVSNAVVEPNPWDDPRETNYARPFIDRPAGTQISALTFKPARNPWYRTTRAAMGLIAVAGVALLFAIAPLVLRGDASGPADPTGVAPTPSTGVAPSSAPPSPTGAQPNLTSAPAPPPPPPPEPPPPLAPGPVQDSAPAYTPYYPPRNSSPPPSRKPDIGVTRSPISVAPDVRGPIPNPATQNRNGDNSGW